MGLGRQAALGLTVDFWHGFLHVVGVWPTPPGTSPWYQLWSGLVPALTVVSLVTLLAGAWHRVNCHEPGCLRIGRHRLNGQTWCDTHQDQARPVLTTEELLMQVIARLDTLIAHLQPHESQ